MKRTLLTIGIAIISMCTCFGQKMPKLHNETIEASKEYQNGNAFQKDLLLYVDMLGKTHPYYAEKKNVARLNRDAKKWYKECGNITDTLKFAAFLQTITIPLNDGHTAVRYWDSFEKVFPIGVIIDGDSPAIVNVTSKDMKDCLGKSIKTINGKSLKDILNIARPYVSADNWLNYEDLVAQFFSFANFGVDMSLFDSRVSLSLDAYIKNTNDMLVKASIPITSGFEDTTETFTNAGKMRNKGVEMTLRTINLKGIFSWESALTATYNKNEILDLNSETPMFINQIGNSYVTMLKAGYPINVFYGYVTDGLFQNWGEVNRLKVLPIM